MSKRFFALLLALVMMFCTVSCGSEESKGNISIWYRDQTKASLVTVSSVLDMEQDIDLLISAIWGKMQDHSEGSGYISVVPAGLTLKSFSIEENNLLLNFDNTYPAVNTPEEVLFRAAVVKTFSQLDIVSSVEFLVDSQLLTDRDGNALGPQKRMHFVDVMEQGLNEYLFTNVTLYYLNADGDMLLPVREELAYRSEQRLAQAVIGRLIVGAAEHAAGRVLPADTKVISVSVKDSICYVNLNNAAQNVEFTVKPELILYSIVNSLTELPGISAVSISINGASGLFMDTIDLSKPLLRNLDYVENTSAGTEVEE